MNTRLVLWGEIGTDRKALIAIHLDEETAKIHIHAFPKEDVTKEIQDAVFVEWKNGGEYTFPDNAIHWEIDANSDTILPEEVKVDRLDVVLQSQHKWGKKLMSSKINQLLTDEVKLLEEKASVVAEYDQSLWDKAKAQWEKIASYQKKNEISWEQTTVLKDKINAVFEALKAVKRINNENEDQANAVLVKNYYKRIEDLQAKLIYNDQWKFIFEELKKIQTELKDAAIRWNHKRTIYNQVNAIFDDLRKYRMTEVVSKTQGRISQLTKILDGLKDSIARDNESYTMQVEKMQHYTRGKLSVEELKSRFGDILNRTKEKEAKAEGIKQTIAQLKADIEKEKKQQVEREQLKLKREQEEAAKQQELEAKKLAKKEAAAAENEQIEHAQTAVVAAVAVNTDEQITEPVIEQPTVEEPVAQVVEAAEIPTITDVPEVLETTTAEQVSDENEQSANA
ncbi:MAG TPA: hypothetical protein PK546_02880 [Chitinophagales bacterium]|nr:hypothetical protein [Chitinophagales bacterium]